MRIAIYPGTFDPITNGHLDVITRALSLCDSLIVAIAERREKAPLFAPRERVQLIKNVLMREPRVEVEAFKGLVTDFAKAKKATFLIRGLRAISDFDYELQMALTNRKLAPEIETIFLMPAENYIFISSSLVKEIARLGGDVRELVPPAVEKLLLRRFHKNKAH
ncbi:pantetheine-phosphate adenylyltransferase [candidate division WOR-3 bacterium]|nr:pantetheine-phosphate adenylyltransferase [candidate division WOR-3 bacterium]